MTIDNRPPRRRSPRVRAALAGVLAALTWGASAHAQDLPNGFYVENAASGAVFNLPTTLAFAPDGRLFVGEKGGKVFIVQNGVKLPTPFIDLEWDVLNHHDRGFLGMVLDPDFANTGYIYFMYTCDWNLTGDGQRTDIPGRLVRYTADAGNPNVADLNSRLVLIGATYATGIPACYFSHAPGSLRFGSDGTLLISAGDAADYNQADHGGLYPDCFGPGKFPLIEDIGAYRSQWIGSMSGKILRVDRATGLGLPSNPYYTGNPADVQSKVWAYGLRNPFRFGVRPNGSADPADGNPGSLFIGDVGWNTYEEVNVSRAGGGENFGWPCREGMLAQPTYNSTPDPAHHGCATIGTPENPGPITHPITHWHHSDGSKSFPSGIVGATAIGGAFYQGSKYPPEYQGVYFYGDYTAQWIKALTVDADDDFVSQSDFGDAMGGVVDIGYNPNDQYLYYVDIFSGQVLRIRHIDGDSNNPPIARATVTPRWGATPLLVQFNASASTDPDNDAITFDWDFGDGQSSTQAVVSHTYTTAGDYVAHLTVRDEYDVPSMLSFNIAAGNTPPNGAILSPQDGATFSVGQTVALWGSATDAEAPPGSLSFHWEVTQIHNMHNHPDFFQADDSLAFFDIVAHGLPNEVNLLRVDLEVSDASLIDTTTIYLALARAGETDVTDNGTPIALVTAPTGSGNKSLAVIHDGVFPPVGSGDPLQQYDTYNGGGPRALDWIGYSFATTRYFSKLVFQEGIHFGNGGWFENLGVEVFSGGVWTPVANLHAIPLYRGNDGSNYDTYTLTFTAQTGTAVRVVGPPGGNADYISVGELRVFEIPRADFTADVRLGGSPLTVQFTDLSNVPGASAWLWHFGDGATSTLQNPSHIYSVPGPHTVNVSVTGPNGVYFEEKTDYVFVGTPGLTGEYFDEVDFTSPALTRIDPVVDFSWGTGAPDPSMGVDAFSIRWRGWIQPRYTETYQLRTTTDDGVRLWVDGQLVIDHWVNQTATEWTATLPLAADRLYDIRMEYFDNTGAASALLRWSSPSQALETIPQSRLWAHECGQGVGDMDGNGTLTPGDALCVFNTYLNGQVVPPSCDALGYDCEQAAADADCSGMVTPADALAVYQRYLLSQPIDVCLGQNGPQGGSKTGASESPPRVTTTRRVDGGDVVVTLSVDSTSPLDAFGLRVVVPPGLELSGLERGDGTRDWILLDARPAHNGSWWVGGFNTRGRTGSTELFSLRVHALDLGADPAEVRFTDFVDDLSGAVEGEEGTPSAPVSFHLYQNHPNPFNPQTTIRFDVPAGSGPVPVRLAIYSVRGERVRVLVDQERAPGAYSVIWDGRDQNGLAVGSGVYFYHLRAGRYETSRRMVLLK